MHRVEFYQSFLLQVFFVVQLASSSGASEPFRSNCKRNGKFSQPVKDYVLSGHVFESHQVTSRFECATLCLDDIRCKSYNYRYTGTDCQLNDASKTGLGVDLTSQAGYSYYENDVEMKLGCQRKPCKRGSCVDGCDGPVCNCEGTLFKGRYCEEIDEKKFLNQSVILNNELDYRSKLANWVNLTHSPWTLCYRATRDGWHSTIFHANCDRRGPTISVIKVGQFIFGGFIRNHWAGVTGYRQDGNAFIFSLRNNDDLPPFKLNVKSGRTAYMNTNYGGPRFGTSDISIYNDANVNTNSKIDLGQSYELPPGYNLGEARTNNLLAGSSSFTVDEIEVFYTREPTLKENSEILKDYPSYTTQLLQWLNTTTRWRLCWRTSEHGWDTKIFHKNCDMRGPTVSLIEVGKNIFGGYSEMNVVGGSASYVASHSSFIFSLVNNEDRAPFKSPVLPASVRYALCHGNGRGPTFGGGYDIYIADSANSNTNSYTNFAHTYQEPSGVTDSRTILAGTYNFSPTSIEVFYQATDDLLYHSAILSHETVSLRLTLFSFLSYRTGWINCWRGTRDGWSPSVAHSRCDFNEDKVIVVRVGSYIFGGYTSLDFNAGSSYTVDSSAFIFSLRNKEGLAPFKSSQTSSNHAVYLSTSYVACFGGGHDMCIKNNANTNSHTNFGHSYAVPSGVSDKSTLLAGVYSFRVDEIEIFYKIIR